MSTGWSRYSKIRSKSASDVCTSRLTPSREPTGKNSRVCSAGNETSIGFTLASSAIRMLGSFTARRTRLFFPVGSLLGVSLDVQTSLALFDRIFEYLDQPVDIAEKPDARTSATAGDVVYDGVWFRYGGDTWTLEDVSFTVPAGTTTALVGETGAGKTTLGDLAARLYDVNRGSVSIGAAGRRD